MAGTGRDYAQQPRVQCSEKAPRSPCRPEPGLTVNANQIHVGPLAMLSLEVAGLDPAGEQRWISTLQAGLQLFQWGMGNGVSKSFAGLFQLVCY